MVRQLYRQSFGLGFSMRLATRPEKHLGTEAEWEAAEEALRSAMLEALQDATAPTLHGKQEQDESGGGGDGSSPTVVVEPDALGDGAFYGPKIDITATDALGRQHQCATIQLDFQLAGRFGLQYSAANGSLKTPVIVHRALLGQYACLLACIGRALGSDARSCLLAASRVYARLCCCRCFCRIVRAHACSSG
jgi:threonyl-tRNA synthetase